jgi:glycosyltransferase involved in cell wall biosynthesis
MAVSPVLAERLAAEPAPPIVLPRKLTEEPLVAVFTPVYNGERYLAECIESVLQQTYGNWEYLIADNASTDSSNEIAQHYAARDARVRVHRFADYLPTIPNWNRAIPLLARESVYTKFVFADDWLYPECLEQMVGVAVEAPSVTLVGSYRLVDDRVSPPIGEFPFRLASRLVVDGRFIAEQSLRGGRDLFGSPSSVLYRSDRVRARGEEFFDEARLPGDDRPILREGYVNHHSDTFVCYELLRDGDWGFVPRFLSFTRVHPDTITNAWTVGAGTWTPGMLWATVKWGPEYLEPSELGRKVRELRRLYLLQLVKALLKLRLVRDRRYRNYHREALRRLRQMFAQSSLELGVGLASISYLLETLLS